MDASSNTASAGSFARASRIGFLILLGAAVLFYGASTLHWPMIEDSAVMHYVVFLVKHGLRPYRDITDNNLPGTYLLERAAMFLFGGSDLGWRLYDLFLLAALTAAMVVIALPYDWIAGVFAGGLFTLQHGSEGFWFIAEREQEMAVLLAIACACLFTAVRRRKPAWVACFGLLAGFAASIKPTLAPFGLVALCLLPFVLRRRGLPLAQYLLFGIGGLCVAVALSLLFLWHYHAFHAFVFVLRTATPVYASLGDPSRRYLVLHSIPPNLLPLLLLAALAVGVDQFNGTRWTWEQWILFLGACFGLLSYFTQRKGFVHHRYIFLVFGLLLAGTVLFQHLRSKNRLRWLAYGAMLYAALFVIPIDLYGIRIVPDGVPMEAAMQSDLEQLGGHNLQGQVQCFDVILGCLNAMYHLRIMENTGFTGDLLLFSRRPNPATIYYQDLFWQLQTAHPANVLVVTNQDFGLPVSFNRLQRWPMFDQALTQDYTLAVERRFPMEGKLRTEAPAKGDSALAYRIYLRKGTTFPPLDVSPVAGQEKPSAPALPASSGSLHQIPEPSPPVKRSAST